jgi:hypothetical protein
VFSSKEVSMHDEHVSRTIEMVQSQILNLEKELAEKKRMVNSLCGLVGRSPVYANTEPGSGISVGIRSDEFYGKPLASVVRAILEKRSAAGLWAASLDEIFEAMLQGGFRFDAKNDGTAKRALAISLSKNTVTFHRLPNGNIGLTEWYPEAAKNKPVNGSKKEEARQTEKPKPAANEEEDYVNEFAVEEVETGENEEVEEKPMKGKK